MLRIILREGSHLERIELSGHAGPGEPDSAAAAVRNARVEAGYSSGGAPTEFRGRGRGRVEDRRCAASGSGAAAPGCASFGNDANAAPVKTACFGRRSRFPSGSFGDEARDHAPVLGLSFGVAPGAFYGLTLSGIRPRPAPPVIDSPGFQLPMPSDVLPAQNARAARRGRENMGSLPTVAAGGKPYDPVADGVTGRHGMLEGPQRWLRLNRSRAARGAEQRIASGRAALGSVRGRRRCRGGSGRRGRPAARATLPCPRR